jgi:hypothetical protein
MPGWRNEESTATCPARLSSLSAQTDQSFNRKG